MISVFITKSFWLVYALLAFHYNVFGQTTNICGNVDCALIGNLQYNDLCKKPTHISETTRNKICGNSYTSCNGISCKFMCNCKVYSVANCCYSGKQCTSDFVKNVCGSLT